MPETLIGTAGWAVPSVNRSTLPENGTHLEKYATVFRAVEINSSFHRSHRRETYEKWRDAVNRDFQFSVKLPKTITHEKRLRRCKTLLDAFCQEVSGLKSKLGCLLVQLPPSFSFEARIAKAFFKNLRARFSIDIACEPRHMSWFDSEADSLLRSCDIARVVADPATIADANISGGSMSVHYYRLHGSPRMYYSKYTPTYLRKLTKRFAATAICQRIWCFFDNTAAGAAWVNAQQLSNILSNQSKC